MELTIQVDVPDGYEATGEYRTPQKGEHFLLFGEVVQSAIDYRGSRYIILRPKWKPPTWLKDGTWIACDGNDDWYAFATEPRIVFSRYWEGSQQLHLRLPVLDFTPPHCTDWRESKRQIRHG